MRFGHYKVDGCLVNLINPSSTVTEMLHLTTYFYTKVLHRVRQFVLGVLVSVTDNLVF